jgi:hypothetical protein
MRVAMPHNCLNVTKISVPFGGGARQPDLYNSEWNHRAKSHRDPLFRRDQYRLAPEQPTSASGQKAKYSLREHIVRFAPDSVAKVVLLKMSNF